MEAGAERPSVQEPGDEDPEPRRGEGPVGGCDKVGDPRLSDFVRHRGRPRCHSCSLIGRESDDGCVFLTKRCVAALPVSQVLGCLPCVFHSFRFLDYNCTHRTCNSFCSHCTSSPPPHCPFTHVTSRLYTLFSRLLSSVVILMACSCFDSS